MSDTSTKSQRNYAGSCELSLGLATATVALAPVGRQGSSKDGELSFACPNPAHVTPERVEQVYRCKSESCGALHREHEMRRCRVVDDESAVYIDPAMVEAIRTGNAPKNSMEIQVCPAEQVEALTLPGSTAYRCRLIEKASQRQREAYALLLRLASDDSKALIGLLRLRDARKVYRIISHRGQLTIVSLTLPSALEPVDEFEVPTLDAKVLKMADTLVKSLIQDFDPSVFEWDVAAAMATAVSTVESTPAPVAAQTDDDIVAAMSKMLEQGRVATPSRKARPRKSPAKKVAAKKTPAKENHGS